MTPEFSRRLVVNRIPSEGLEETIEATPEECAALARRFDLPAILGLRARFNALPWRRGGVALKGVVEAEVERICVVSLDPFTTGVREEVERYYLAETSGGSHPTVLSLESLEDDEPDTIEGGAIDLGELAAETLGLALDPYPRKPGIEFEGVPGSGDGASPRAFDTLSKLTKA